MKHLILSLSVACSLFAGPRDAAANANLEASLRAEVDAVGGIIKSIDAGLTAAKRGSLSERSAKAHRAAKQQYRQADQLCRARKYEECYGKLRLSKKTVMPAVLEVMETGAAADVQLVVAMDIEAAAQRIAGVATLLAPGASVEATTAYKHAEVLYQEGKALFEKGKHREAFAKLEPALDQLDIAIRSVWSARPPKRR